MDKFATRESFGCQILPPPGNQDDQLVPKGRYVIQILNEKNELVHEEDFNNLVTNVGKNYILDAAFNAGSQVGSAGWYMGLIGNTSFSALAPGDTAASHAGWTEATAYSQSTRPAWGPGAAASQQVTNSTPVEFSINSTVVIKGFFIISNNTKGGTTGTLMSEGLFSAGDQTLNNGYTLRCVYVIGF